MAAARKRRARDDNDDDDDDDDIPARVGRPRTPEQFGPPKPEPHQREEYVARLQSILDALEIPTSAEKNGCTASAFSAAPTVCTNLTRNDSRAAARIR